MQLTKHWVAELDDYAIDLAWSPDGAILAAASAAGPVTLFGAGDGGLRHALPGHESGTNAIAWAPSAAALATGGQDGAVKFWDPASGQHTATAALGRGGVEHLGWRPADPSGAAVLAAALGRKLAFLRADGSIQHPAADLPKTISALQWQPAGDAASDSVLAIAFFGGVQLLAGADFRLHREFPYGNGIQALVWSPDRKWLVSGNQDPSVHLWIPARDEELQMSGYESKVRHLSFDATSRWLATSGGRDACIWDCSGPGPEGREPKMLPHDHPVCAVAFQRGHGLLATAAANGTVNLWSPERKQPLRATVQMPSTPTRLAWSPDDRQLAIGSEKGVVYVLKCDA